MIIVHKYGGSSVATTEKKVRHGQSETKGLLFYKNNELFVEFEKQVRAPNKGQSAVFYLDDIVVGGGIIDEVY